MTAAPAPLPDLRTTLVVVVEVSKIAWVIGAHVPGSHRVKVKQRLERRTEALIKGRRRHGALLARVGRG